MSHKKFLSNPAMRFFLTLKPYYRSLSLLLAINIILVVMYIPGPLLISYLFDHVLLKKNSDELSLIMISLLCCYLSIPILSSLSLYINNSLQHRISYDIRLDYIDGIFNKDISFLKKYKVPDLLSRLRDASSARKQVIRIINMLFSSCCFLFSIPIVMITISSKLTIISLMPIPVLFIVNFFISKYTKRRAKYSALTQSGMSSASYESLYIFKTIKKLGIKSNVLRRLKVLSLRFRKEDMNLRVLNSIEIITSGVIFSVSLIICVFWGTKMTLSGKLSIGDFSAFLMLSSYLRNPLSDLFKVSIQLKEVEAYAKRYLDIVDNTSREQTLDIESSSNKKNITEVTKISLNDISLTFGRQHKIFEHVNASFLKGKSYLISGPSGIGKSSLAEILASENSCFKGNFFINNECSSDFSLKSRYRHLVLVPQDSHIFSASFKDNITGFRNEFSHEDIQRVLDLVCLTQVSQNLENGLDTPIGDGGRVLSYGETKRLILARFLLGIESGGVLIIDEGLSNLDEKMCINIFNNICNVIKPNIMIVISHEKTLSSCVDQVMRVDNFNLMLEDLSI